MEQQTFSNDFVQNVRRSSEGKMKIKFCIDVYETLLLSCVSYKLGGEEKSKLTHSNDQLC